MPTTKSPRKGSLQYWPRKRASKFLPSVNWNSIDSDKILRGFIGYKAGMASAYVKNDTNHSMTKGKKIVVPVTIIECPNMKIFSVRLYKNGIVSYEILNKNLSRDLKRKVKIPKKANEGLDKIDLSAYDDLRVIVYSLVKKTGIKKTPDLSEIGLSGNMESKFNFVKENWEKEISLSTIFEKGDLVDVRGLTKGKGLVGPVKRFGIKLKRAKSEKGRRRPGSLAPWNPSRVTFRAPLSGQLGMFTRVVYNNKILDIGSNEGENKTGIFKKFGDVKTNYLIVAGSVQGPSKRQLLITAPLRKTKRQIKKNYEFLELR